MIFKAIEHKQNSVTPTGRIEYYQADNIVKAVEHCRYTHALKGPATIGPTGRVVHCPSEGVSFTVLPDK